MYLDHLAIIVSSEEGVDFYKSLGFKEIERQIRPQTDDEIVVLKSDEIRLELYKDPTHPARATNPEAYGLRHLCIAVEDLEKYGVEIKHDQRGAFLFVYDPDGLPVELRDASELKGEKEC